MRACPYCTTMLQRTYDGTEEDGLLEHIKVVHPDKVGRPIRY